MNCITADEHMLGYAGRVKNTNDCVCSRCMCGSCSCEFLRLKDSGPVVTQRLCPSKGQCRPRTAIFLPELMAVVFPVLGPPMSQVLEVKRSVYSWQISGSKTLEIMTGPDFSDLKVMLNHDGLIS